MEDIWIYIIPNLILIGGTVAMNWWFCRQFKNCPCKRGDK